MDFNLASPKQLGELLFDTLGLDRKKSRRTKTGYSTDATVLEKLAATTTRWCLWCWSTGC